MTWQFFLNDEIIGWKRLNHRTEIKIIFFTIEIITMEPVNTDTHETCFSVQIKQMSVFLKSG